ncbi:MAG: 1-acyl-sn-glycerol-3-phosphate acyltransferase [Candidatus Omnitrophica bacterium]|nr:1-acyl-sn-glycerol-3-phosphate acyltransferase [Candidatus Omnitrophota bacterium]
MKNSFYLFCRFMLFVNLKLLFFFKVKGRSFVPKHGGCIIASNHLSYLDPIVLSVASPRILSFMAKKELFSQHGKFFKWLITALNAFPLERGTADLKAIRFAINKLKAGHCLIVFPEGTRSSSGEVRDPQAGVSMLAAKANVPVIPAFITGSDKALPAKSKKVVFFTPMSVSFGPALMFKPDADKNDIKADYQMFSNQIIQQIRLLENPQN